MPENDPIGTLFNTPIISDNFALIPANVIEHDTDEHTSFTCCECQTEFPMPCEHIINEQYYCSECESNLPRCVDCDSYILDNSFIDSDDGERYCRNCYYERYTRCYSCDCEITHNESYCSESDGESYCSECYPRDNNGCLQDWEYKPKPIYHRGRNESTNTPNNTHNLYFGIELEIESEDNDIEYAVDRLSDFVYAKADGSLNDGFEVVSHPTTYQWLCENPDQWLEILALRKDGFRSYNTNTCGMHVHLSKNYFSTLHLYKFLKFFYENPEFILMISQRSQNRLDEWATLKTKKTWGDADDESIYYKSKHKTGNWQRHSAVNLQNDHTIEIRIFRGTLNPRSFWKNIEFLQALVEFTAKESIDDISVMKFRCFLFENKRRFVNLYNWLFIGKFAKGATIE